MDAMNRFKEGSEYRILNEAIKNAIRRSAGSVVMLGHLLRRMMDEKLWEGHYSSLDDYLRAELHMDYTMACRFEAINRKYSIGGKSGHIDEKWEDYSQGALYFMNRGASESGAVSWFDGRLTFLFRHGGHEFFK